MTERILNLEDDALFTSRQRQINNTQHYHAGYGLSMGAGFGNGTGIGFGDAGGAGVGACASVRGLGLAAGGDVHGYADGLADD